DKPIAYSDMAKLLNVSQRVIGSAVKRLIERGEISKEDHGRIGAYYIVHHEKARTLPVWLAELTAALIDLNNNADLKASAVKETEEINFQRGLAVLKDELRAKFYRRDSGDKKP